MAVVNVSVTPQRSSNKVQNMDHGGGTIMAAGCLVLLGGICIFVLQSKHLALI